MMTPDEARRKRDRRRRVTEPAEDGAPSVDGGDEGPVDDSAVVERIEFDATGLDLARQIAAAASRSTPLPTPRAPRKPKRGQPGRTASGTRDPQSLGEALGHVIEERGWSTEVNVHLLLGRWAELVGPAVAEHSHPEAFVDAVVVVRTTSTNWAAQLRLIAPQLLAKLNASLGEGTIKRLQIVGPEAPSWKHGIRSVRDGRGPRDTYG